MDIERNIVSLKLLGKERKTKNSKVKDFAIQVTLSDESIYTVYRSKKQIAGFNHKLINKFPVEAGYFNDRERIIPDCPFKKTPFGIKQSSSNDAEIGRHLNSYLKKLSSLPSKIIKCEIVVQFTSLWTIDMELDSDKHKKETKSRLPKRNQSLRMTNNSKISKISKPIQLRSYMTVADFKGKKFAFRKDMIVQVLQKESTGWWLIDVHGELGWAPASYLILEDEDDISKEEEENEALIVQDRVGARYLSTGAYTAKRDDELSFLMGSIVRVVKKYIDGWWLVKYNGHEGFVPGSMFKKFDKRQATAYVKNIKRKFSTRKTTIVPNPMNWQKDGNALAANTVSTERQNVAVYECVAQFIGKPHKFEISLNRGDMVHLLEEKENGWWYVRDWHGRAGWFPASYLRDVHTSELDADSNRNNIVGSKCIVVSSFDSQSDKELSISKDETVIVLSASDDGWWTVRRVNDPNLTEGLVPSVCLQELKDQDITNNADTQTMTASPIDNDDNVFPDDSSHWLEQSETNDGIHDCYVVKTNYFKQSPDEIDALEGEIVCIIDNTHQDTWYVEIDGKEGWIPSNILRPMTDSEFCNTSSPEDTPSPDTPSPSTPSPSIPIHDVNSSPAHNTTAILKQSIPSSGSEQSIYLCVASISTDSYSSSEEDEDLEEIERALREAERIAKEANEKATTLRRKAEKKKEINSDKKDGADLIEHPV